MGESIRFGSFNIDNLYGGDVAEKVMRFAEMSALLATKMNFDVIHAHDWMTMIAGIKIKQVMEKLLVMHIHSIETDCSGYTHGWVYELEKKGMELADLLIPVSNYTANSIQAHYGISRNKMLVIHNGSKRLKTYWNKRSLNAP